MAGLNVGTCEGLAVKRLAGGVEDLERFVVGVEDNFLRVGVEVVLLPAGTLTTSGYFCKETILNLKIM